jgi:hypothetical protein
MYPPEARVKKWNRTFIILDNRYLVIRDDVEMFQPGSIKGLFHLAPGGTLIATNNSYQFQDGPAHMVIKPFGNIELKRGINKIKMHDGTINLNDNVLFYEQNNLKKATVVLLFRISNNEFKEFHSDNNERLSKLLIKDENGLFILDFSKQKIEVPNS